MTVYEYRTKLLAALAEYDAVEVVNAANYYAELIEDADDPEEQMNRLGPPEELARMIIEENGWENLKRQSYYEQASSYPRYEQSYGEPGKPGRSGAGRVIALILTFPLWITVYALIIALFAWVLALMICLPVAFISVMIHGISAMGTFIPYGIEMMFTALIILGLFVITAAAARPLLSGTGGLFGRFSRFLFGTGRKEEGLVPHEHRGVNKAALVIGAVMLVAGIIGTAVTETHNRNNISEYIEAQGIVDLSYDIAEVPDHVYANIQSGKLNIGKSSDGQAHLRCERVMENRLEVIESNTLEINYITSSDDIFDFPFMDKYDFDTNPTFILELPDNQYSNMYIELSLGGLNAEGINADNMVFINHSGAVSLKDCKAQNLTLTNDLGSIKAENVKADKLNSENCSGRTVFSDSIFSTAEIFGDLGAMELRRCTLGDTILNNGSGRIDIDKCSQTGTLDITDDLGSVKIDESIVDILNANLSSGKFKMEESAVKGSAEINVDLGGADLDLVNGSYNVNATSDLGHAKVNGEDAANAPSGTIPISVHSDSGSVDVTLN